MSSDIKIGICDTEGSLDPLQMRSSIPRTIATLNATHLVNNTTLLPVVIDTALGPFWCFLAFLINDDPPRCVLGADWFRCFNIFVGANEVPSLCEEQVPPCGPVQWCASILARLNLLTPCLSLVSRP